jgi:phosphatidylserine/phosphatidylglycerophosphate/cardiolipin synthase-like enzyme
MDIMPGVLEKARKSIYIEQQYIKTGQPGIQKLLQAIVRARTQNPKLDVRVVLAKPLGDQNAVKKSVAEMNALSQFGLQIGKNVRLLNPKNFVHCHNKLILIDGDTLLVSSQNWSDSAVLKNREAGLLMTFPSLAKYYTEMFISDWENGVKTLAGLTATSIVSATALNSGKKLVRLELGDYLEV